MKRFLHCTIIILCLSLTTTLPGLATGVVCNATKTMCTVGNYTFQGTNLYAANGIMCNTNKTLCTNGETVYSVGNTGIKNSSSKKHNIITQISKADILTMVATMYSEGLIKQSEYNSIKANWNSVDVNKIVELQKMGNLYKNNLITQSEYNRAKNIMLK